MIFQILTERLINYFIIAYFFTFISNTLVGKICNGTEQSLDLYNRPNNMLIKNTHYNIIQLKHACKLQKNF